MDFLSYVTENALIIIPVLYIIGMILRNTEKIKNKYIPLILLPIGIGLAMGIMRGITVDAVIQGVLVTGATVYTDQVIKQVQRKD